ncbi:FtsX-like permease family protein [Lacimicrobium sp. SS2-24]|uniref:ABC transporter permease n=1 Tax=Lacimicrobium sp. SS2-24 TaxID=2005569 RepID=UPI000B4AF179|nr:FtsX-like permease family protein [Lacimicrobium sp. SS2-24]
MFSNTLRLAWQLHHQEKGSVYNRSLRWIQSILMVFIVTLSLTSESVQDYLNNNLQNLLGADLVLSQSHPLSQAQWAELKGLSKNAINTQQITATLTHNGQWQRATLKAVGEDYPLQGEMKTSSALGEEAVSTAVVPAEGEIWLDPRLLSSLSVDMGDTLMIAQQAFIVSRVLHHEPDRLMEGHNVDMRALINRNDLPGLNVADDNMHYRYLVLASKSQTHAIINWQKTHLPAARIHHKQGAHPLALFWKRTENFIGLASVVLFFMAAIAIQQIAQVKMKKEQFFTAVCLSLGASRASGVQIALIKWVLSILSMLPAVVFFCTLCHWLIVQWLASNLIQLEWQFSLSRFIEPLLASMLIFAVFQAPVWMALKQSSVRQLVYNSHNKGSALVSIGCALLVLVGVAATYSDNGLLTVMVLGAMLSCVALMLLSSWVSLTLGEKLTSRHSGLVPFALFMMKQRLLTKTTQILGVGLCAFLLLFTLMLLRDIGNTMQGYKRQHDGNLMVSQASEAQMRDVILWADEHGAELRQSKPFMHAKLIAVNQQRLEDFADKPSGSLATLQSAIRLHWTDVVPHNNRVVEGTWWQPSEPDWQQISVEEEVMSDLGLQLGDRLTFYIGEQSVEFTIAASHVYTPGAGSITFWIQMPPSALSHLQAPRYYMASLELAPSAFTRLSDLWQAHPSLRMVPMKEMIARFDNLLAMVTRVVSGFALLIISLAGIVIVSSVHALEANERKKNSVIMSFGLSRGTCLRVNGIEWLTTALIAAAGAIMGTWVAGLLIYQSQFSMNYQPDVPWLLTTLAIIVLVVMALGLIASRTSLNSSIRDLMQE